MKLGMEYTPYPKTTTRTENETAPTTLDYRMGEERRD